MQQLLISLLLLVGSYAQAMDYIQLPAPDLSRSNFIETRVGLRPYREESIRIQVEPFPAARKVIVHNYGHGGCGITLSWGSTISALKLLNTYKTEAGINYKNAAVIGAGVIGLTQAYQLLQEGYDVSLYAQTLSPRTTSDVAAGIWAPAFVAHGETEAQKELFNEIEKDSFEIFAAMADGYDVRFAGVSWVDGYRIMNREDDLSEVPWYIRDFNKHTKIKIGDSNEILAAASYKFIVIDMSQYMPALWKSISQQVPLQVRKINSVEELLQLPHDIIFNCTGLGSRELFNDTKLSPIWGQIVAFKQNPDQPINYAIINRLPHSDHIPVLIPWKDRVLVGTIARAGREDITEDKAITDVLVTAIKEVMHIQ